MSIDLDALDSLAKAATPGEWEYIDWNVWTAKGGMSAAGVKADPDDGWLVTAIEYCETFVNGQLAGMTGPEMIANGKFIAAANPAVVQALIARLRKAEKALAKEHLTRGETFDQALDEAMQGAEQ